VAAAVLAAVALGLALEWTWGQDDRIAGLLADRLLDPDANPRRTVDVPDGPGSAWWATTSGHLYLRALADNRRENDPDRSELVRFDLEAARGAAPLDRAVRLASATESTGALGLSRDIIAQRRTGRALAKAGKTEAALAAFRRAMEMAAHADPARAPLPSFDEDAQVRRFRLPGEDALAAIVRDALPAVPSIDDLARCEAILPDSPVAVIAAYRVLSDRGCPGIDRLLSRILEAEHHAKDPLTLAAQAEAQAYRGGWDRSAELYRSALEGLPIRLPVRRALALNLAEVEGRLGHVEAVRQAWDEARGPDPSDPVNVRLAEARQNHGELARPGLLSLPNRLRRDDQVAPATLQREP
jgi:hypothetical protein